MRSDIAFGHLYRERNIREFSLGFGAIFAVTFPVFIESGYNAVAVCCNVAVEPAFLSFQPVSDEVLVRSSSALQASEIEVRIAESLAVESSLYPVMIHPEGPQENTVVVFP